jgi:LysM repeat protein
MTEGPLSRYVLILTVLLCWTVSVPAVGQETDGWITVRPGDTLFSLARSHGVSVDDLRAWNDLTDSGIRSGMRLRIRPESSAAASIPVANPDLPEPEVMQVLPGGRVAIIVQEGESFADVAGRHGLSTDSLAIWNPGLPLPIEAGMAIVVPGREVIKSHTVKRGETLYAIARQYDARADRILALNPGLEASTIRVGQRLAIPATDAPVQGASPLQAAGSFPLRDYPAGMTGRVLPGGYEIDAGAFQVAHPQLPAGSLVLVQAASGAHAFAEVVETAVTRRPMFVEGSAALLRALGIEMGEPVSFRLVR